MYTQLILNLGVVITLIIAYFYVVQYLNKRNNKTKQLEILETISLNYKEKLILVKAGRKKILLGVTQQNINLLTDLNSSDSFQKTLSSIEMDSIETIDQSQMRGKLGHD